MEPTSPPEPTFEDLERTIASVPGVVSAQVSRSQEGGRGRLRIRLAPGQDAHRVSEVVATTLQERFGILLAPEDIQPQVARTVEAPVGEDLASIVAEALGGVDADPDQDAVHVHREDAEVAPAGTPAATYRDHAPRAMIRDLIVRRHDEQVLVTAVLSLHGRAVIGQAAGLPTQAGGMRAAAEATLAALRVLTGGLLEAGIDHVSFVEGPAEAEAVTVGVTVSAQDLDQALIGAAVLRDGTELAVMRATLDALNRRVEPLLHAGELAATQWTRAGRPPADPQA